MAKDNIRVKYLLVRQEMFYRKVDAKGMKTKNSKETVKTFFGNYNQKEKTKESLSRSGDRICWRFQEIVLR